MTFIHRIGLAVPPTSYTQEQALAQMLEILTLNAAEKRKFQMIYRNSGIDKRHTAMPNFFARFSTSPTPTIADRMKLFWQYAPPLCLEAVQNCLPPDFDKQQITHLLTVSCTGLAAPGLDILLLQQLQLPTTIYRTAINFMGCYAGFHALKHADLICKANPKAKVLIVGVELCSLHFQHLLDDDNTRANLLFADGAAAVLLSAHANELALPTQTAIQIHNFYAEVILQGEADMAWFLTPAAFQMRLSAYIPQLVEENIAELLAKALQKLAISKEQIQHWAIHPGGKTIVDKVAKVLELSPEKLAIPYQILKNYGNMSSVTMLFILQSILHNQPIKGNNYLFAAGFGPGLTMESMVAELVFC